MSNTPPIRVLVVDDSASARMLLVHILEADPRIRVVTAVPSGEKAIETLGQSNPDLILMDIHLPGINGYDTTRRIMETRPVPIVVCSAVSAVTAADNVFRAMDAGAVAVVEKPVGIGHPEFSKVAAKLVETVTLMAEIKVVRRWPHRKPAPLSLRPPLIKPSRAAAPRAVAIGASTGGPPVLQSILSALPASFPAPVLIVQHIVPGFLGGLVQWLGQTTRFPVKIAEAGEELLAGHAYLAPDGHHFGIGRSNEAVLSLEAPDSGLRPSVSHLFRSVGDACGANAAAVLLTGMGKDGAHELKQLHDLGALTIAQDAASSIVHGMPGEAIKLGGARFVLAPEQIPEALTAWSLNSSQRPDSARISPA